ncbi:DUF4158 domain-containing protein [Nonomuraea sp. CA-141351]|uniref:DUF4158 domain-containing protein n=1 Tax=Nonomuraea sp. CA-141351 TaxID=3239996 RepID=UPI003D8F8F50
MALAGRRGSFLEDPLDVPGTVLEFVAEQPEVEDPAKVKQYTERRETPFDHLRDIRRPYGWKDFAAGEPEFAAWVTARPGRRATARRRSSPMGWGGCGSGRCAGWSAGTCSAGSRAGRL